MIRDDTDDRILKIASEMAPQPLPGMDLSDEGMLDFLRRQAPLMRQHLERIESVEPWPGDHDYRVVDRLIELGRALTPEALQRLGDNPTPELIKVLGFLRMSRALMIVDRLLDETGDASEAAFITRGREFCLGDPEAMLAFRLLVNRFIYLQRTRLIQRVYSPRRANRLIEALRGVSTP